MWWNWRRAKQRPDLDIVVYTRDHCPLCDKAWQLLLRWQTRHGFVLRSVDIAPSPELTERYGTCIPVVEINGKVSFRGQINPVLFQRIIDAKASA